MYRATDLKPKVPIHLQRCEAKRKTLYSNDTSETNKRCVRFSRYIIDGKYYCKPHAGVRALEILENEKV